MSLLGFTVGTEPLMFLGIGILACGLIALAVLPVVHRRAETLAARRIEAAKPASMSEIQADRDALRADFAISAHRLENQVTELRDKTAAHMAELARKVAMIDRLTAELGARAKRIEALEAREQILESREMALFHELRASKTENARLNDALVGAEQILLDLRAERDRLDNAVAERTRTVDTQRIDIIALQNRSDILCQRVYELANYVRDCESRGAYDRVAFRTAADARGGEARPNGKASVNGAPITHPAE